MKAAIHRLIARSAPSLYFFLTRRAPPVRRILLVESGSRALFDSVLPRIGGIFGSDLTLDLLTCFAGVPNGFDPARGAVFRVGDFPTPESRKSLFQRLAANGYDVVWIICSGEPIMTKWKWATAVKVPAKLLILNENGDYFWCDRSNWGIIRHFVLYRSGLSGAEAVPALTRALLFPFTVLYLVLYAAFVHTRRRVRHP